MKPCSICSRPDRPAIDAALVAGVSLRSLLPKHNGTTVSALHRHQKHIPAALVQAKQAVQVAEATTLLSRVEKLMFRCESIFERAEKAEQWTGAIGAAREMRGCLELLAKLSGELQPNGARLAINFGDITKINIRQLSDEQLEALYERLEADRNERISSMSNEEIEAELERFALKAGLAGRTLLEVYLFDEETVGAPVGGNQRCWDILDEKLIESEKALGKISPDFECPPPKWTPYRDATHADRFRMLQVAWKKVTGVELPDRLGMQDLGGCATIAIEFDLASPRQDEWHVWPKVKLQVVAVQETDEN